VEEAEPRGLLDTFTVTNTNDDADPGSLRWAITQSNATPGANTIDFDIAPSGVQTISIETTDPATALPAITVPLTINGLTEPGYAGTPAIELQGLDLGVVDGLEVMAGKTTIEGLAIDRFGGNGISLSDAGGDTIQDDFIGTDSTGSMAEGNGHDGVLVQANSNNNTISANVISNNDNDEIELNGQLSGAQDPATSGNLIVGNLIGTDVTGTTVLDDNPGDGILVQDAPLTTIGGTTAQARNIITGNPIGVEMSDNSDGTVVEGNYIGTDATGEVALGDSLALREPTVDDVLFDGISDCTVGGTATGAGNLISGSGMDGIETYGTAGSGLLIEGNLIRTDATGTRALPNLGQGIHLFSDYTDVTIGGSVAGARNVISGNGGDGIDASAQGPVI
jgi:hypothetical protein